MRKVLALDGADNVANALESLAEGDEFEALGLRMPARTAVPRGHKIALVAIARGQPILKYGEAIGRARCDIAPGEHVHTHNVDRLFDDWLTAHGGAA